MYSLAKTKKRIQNIPVVYQFIVYCFVIVNHKIHLFPVHPIHKITEDGIVCWQDRFKPLSSDNFPNNVYMQLLLADTFLLVRDRIWEHNSPCRLSVNRVSL